MDHGNCPIKRCHITRDRDASASYWENQEKITPGGNDPYVFRVYPPVTSGLILLSPLGRAQCRNRYPVHAVTVLCRHGITRRPGNRYSMGRFFSTLNDHRSEENR